MDTMNQNMPGNTGSNMGNMGNMNMGSMPGMQPKKKSFGPLIAVIIILALIIIGGLYFLGQRMNNAAYVPTAQTDSITESLKVHSNSDDLSSIEKDLNNTNTDNLDQGAAAMEAEANTQ